MPFELTAREMMYGIGDAHDYMLCRACGCLQIRDIPADLSPYYGSGYYSFGSAAPTGARARIAGLRDQYAATGHGIVGRALHSIWPTRQFDYLRPIWGSIKLTSRIADIGCGSGKLVRTLRQAGFREAYGIDPFIERPIELDGRTLVAKATVDELSGMHDLVMFHHSLEHMPDQHHALRAAARVLRDGAHCIVRIPVCTSEAFATYREHWVQLDAPRHLYLHSDSSIRRLAEQCGFRCVASYQDSTAFQFWGSEQYRNGMTLTAPSSHAVAPQSSPFQPADIQRFEARAAALNAQGQGDQAVYVLQRAA